LGSGLRNTPKRNWLSTSVRPSLIPHDTVGQQRPHLWLTVTKRGHWGNKRAGALGWLISQTVQVIVRNQPSSDRRSGGAGSATGGECREIATLLPPGS
jgi:hypothetical protein